MGLRSNVPLIVAGANLGNHPPSLFTTALKRYYEARGKRIKVVISLNLRGKHEYFDSLEKCYY
jgi:hypothetical protein